jgi:hypothetical protein
LAFINQSPSFSWRRNRHHRAWVNYSACYHGRALPARYLSSG